MALHRMISSTVVVLLLCFCFIVVKNVKATTVKQQQMTITDTAQYLAKAAATSKLGECLPTSTDDTNFYCFAKLLAVATRTAVQKNVTSSKTTLKYIHNNDCHDNEVEDCPEWAAQGECSVNPDYMLVNCRYSCQSCYDIVDGHGGVVQVAPGSPEQRDRIAKHISSTADYIRTTREQYPNVRSTCRNFEPDCTYKAIQGQCVLGSDTGSYMHTHCPAACRSCV